MQYFDCDYYIAVLLVYCCSR